MRKRIIMKQNYLYIVVAILVAVSCQVEEFEPNLPSDGNSFIVSDEIDATCVMSTPVTDVPFTRALIGQLTTTALDGNFIKVSQPVDNEKYYHSSKYDIRDIEMPSYKEATIVDAQFISPANNIPDLYLRTIVFNPRLTYDYYASEQDSVKDTVAYVSQMVGWYPTTYDVPDGLGEENAQALFKNSGCFKEIDGEVCVEFKNKLDGKTDLMMTDMREGRIYKEHFLNNDNPGCDRNIQPFGAYYNSFLDGIDLKYCNYFTFHHYLTAVRLFIKADDKSSLILSAWGKINNAIMVDQPSSATIALPTVQNTTSESSERVPGGIKSLPFEGVNPVFGEVKSWDDYRDFPIIRTDMFDNNPPDDLDLGSITSQLPIDLEDKTHIDKTYIGYSLIRPVIDEDNDGRDDLDPEYVPSVRLVTEAGIVTAELPVRWEISGEYKTLLQAGCIYDIIIDVKTDGTLDVIVTTEGEQHFNNLSPYNEKEGEYETANCYTILDSDLLEEGKDKQYDGFVFYPEIPATIDGLPYYRHEDIASVAIYWQDSSMPIAHVDYVHDYVRITLNENSTPDNLIEGNAVIAAYDDKRNVIWSWHIWVVDEVNDVEMTMGDGTVSFMDRNLGALSVAGTGNDNLEAYGLYYQWGRKDPSPSPSAYNYDLFDMSVNPISTLNGVQNSVVDKIVNRPTVKDAARYPLALFYPGEPAPYFYNWLYERNDSLWGFDSTRGTGEKTDFDPCPYGYRVPYQELEAVTIEGNVAFAGSRVTVTTSSGTLAFPYAGWKGDDVGSPQQTHFWYKVFKGTDLQNGICDVNGTNGYHRERLLFLKEGYSVLSTGYSYNNNTLYTPFSEQNKGYGNRNAAASIRCVRENKQIALCRTFAEDMIYVKEITGNTVAMLSVNSNLDIMESLPITVYDGARSTSSTLDIPRNTFRWSLQDFARAASFSNMTTVEISGKNVSLMREMEKAGDLQNGGSYMIFARDGDYNTYCLENQDGNLRLVRRTPGELTKDNIFKFFEGQQRDPGNYNSSSFGKLQGSNGSYVSTNFRINVNQNNGVNFHIKNRWGGETGHDIDIQNNNGQYMIYNQINGNVVELSWGDTGTGRYKWYFYPVNPELIPD